MARKQTAFRLPQETLDQLDELGKVYSINRTEFIIQKVAQEYDIIQGNPKMTKLLEALKECEKVLKEVKQEAKANDE